MIKDTVNTQAEGKVHMMPISNELKQAGQHAYQDYNEGLRGEREEKAQRQKERERKEAEKLGEERSRKARRGKKTIGEEFKRQEKEIR
jgi:hypothetical protein